MADDEQFSLCWNNFNTNLSAGFHESLVRGDLVDVTLAAEGQLVKAHRLILSVCSPYFRKMFTQMPANQHAFIFLKDVSHSALKDLIQFMYCGEVNVKQDALPAFISTAEALQIKGLTETGESAPTHPSPAKEPSHLPSASSTTIPSVASSPRAKPVPRSRIQSYKLDSDDGSDHEKVVQIQATSTPASVASASSTAVTGQVSVPQQVQILQQQSQKRTLQQRTSITPQSTQVLKRAKLTDPLEASEPTQIQTVQIVKQITQTPQPTISSEPEYVEMPIETINPKAEPEYADDPSEVEAIEAEHEQEQSLAEQDTAEHDQDQDDSAHYVEDETYGDMSKYDETYFAEGDDAKAGASGFGSESYAESGTGADQAAQGDDSLLEPIDNVPYQYVQRGKTQYLVVCGYSFTKQYTGKKRSTWECCQRRPLGCKVTVSTYANSSKIDVRKIHNHAVVQDRRERRDHLHALSKQLQKHNETGDNTLPKLVDDVQYVQQGRTQYLLLNGHKFTLQRNGKHHSTWECCQRKPLGCKVTAACYQHSEQVDIRRSHNHPIISTPRDRRGRKFEEIKPSIKERNTPPTPATDPDSKIQYVWGKTTLQVMIDGHRFCRKNIYSAYTSYECCQRVPYGCKATVSIYNDDREMSFKFKHNHPIIATGRSGPSTPAAAATASKKRKPLLASLLKPVKFFDTNF